MPIQSVPDGVLDVENATLRASGMVATKDMVIGKTTKKTSDVPTLEVFSENAATIELQSNLARSTNTSNAFARIKADSQALTFESGSGLAHDSKGDIVFSSVGDATKHMVIKGSTGKIGIGVENPSSALDIAGDINLIGQNAKIKMNSDVLVEHAGPHGRGVAPLKKYPEIVFESGKFDSNDSTNTYVQAGYTVSASSTYSDGTYPAWEAFNGIFIAGHDGSSEGWVSSESPATYSTSLTSGEYLATNVDTFTGAPLGERNGSWIKLKLPKKIKLDHVVLKQRFASQGQEYNKNVVIYASINDSIWQSLGSFDASVSETVIFHTNSTAYYDYFVLHVKSSNREFLVAAVEELEYYGYEEDQPLGDTSVDTTFTSIMNTPQTTGANVYVDAKLSADFTNQVTGPTPVGTAAVHDNTNKYWEMNGQLTSNITVEANTFLEGDQPHAVSMWFNSSNLEANVSNSCIFSLATEEKLDSVNLDLQSNTWHNLTYAYQGEGGSRVTYLDGRKVAEDQAEDTFGDYPPFAMTGYSQGGYVASASSEYSSGTYLTWEPYGDGGTDADNSWICSAGPGGTGHYVGTGVDATGEARTSGTDVADTTVIDGVTTYGEWNQVEFSEKLHLSSVALNGINSADAARYPKDAIVCASIDGITWTSIGSWTGEVNRAEANIKHYILNSTKAFKYVRIVVTKISTGYDGITMLSRVRYYGHRENDLVRLPDPTNVLKYPHIAMTGYAQRGYVVSASTQDSTGFAYLAFDGIADGSRGYHGTGVYSSGVYQENDKLTGPGPTDYDGEWIKLELPHKIKVTGVSFAPRTTFPDRIPHKGYILGSNTGSDGSWELVHSFDNVTTTEGVTKRIDFTGTNVYYKHIAMVAEETNPTSGTRLNFSEMEYYGTEEASSVPIQIGGGNIDKVANFRVYDKFVGEDQALEIWDAQKDEFGRAKSSMTLHKGRLGIGTTEPEGRLAVLDEPHNLEEFPPKPLVGYKTHIEGHGVFRVSATSNHTSSGAWYPYYAFDKSYYLSGTRNTWESGYNDYASAAPHNYAGSFSLGGYLGEYIDLKMPYSIKLNNYSVSILGSWTSYAPKDFMILASNDSKTWDQIHSVSGQTWEGVVGVTQTINYNVNDTKYYNHFALLTTALFGNARRVNIDEIKFFGTREQGQSVLHDGQLTLTKNLTVPSIGPSVTNTRHAVPKRHKLLVEFDTSTNPADLTTVRDTSGMGNDGTLIGDAYYSIVDKALVFDGSGDYIQMKDWTYGTGFVHSFSGWVKFKSPEESWQVLYGVGDASGTGRTNFTIWPLTQSNYFRTEADGGGGSIDHTFEFTGNMDKWLHVAVVKSGAAINTTRMYINGEILPQSGGSNASSDIALPNSPQNFNLGSYGPSSASHINADFSNVKFYNAALTAGDVKTLYDMGRGDSYHVTNFQNTLVGINLGNGQAPRSALDVRDKIYAESSTVQTFTGQHICFPDESMEKGLIVSAKKNKFVKLNGLATGKSAITIDESLPIVSLSNVSQDKACFGVVSKMEESNAAYRTEITGGLVSESVKIVGDNRAIVNSVGEGAIWVVDTNGPLESGDYITTSNVAGYGQKQDDDILHNYTVAKITMDCDFTGSNVAVQTIKREETGLRTIMEDKWNQLVDYDRSSNTETQYSNTLAPSAYTDQPGYTPRKVTTIVDYTDGSNLLSIAEWSNLESNIQNTYQSNTFTEIVDYTKFVSFSEWSNLTTDVQNTYSEAEITTYYQIQRGENVLDENGQLQFEDKTGATEAPYERRFLDASGAQTDSANAVHIAAFVGCTYHCG